jgi:hypothetical protein
MGTLLDHRSNVQIQMAAMVCKCQGNGRLPGALDGGVALSLVFSFVGAPTYIARRVLKSFMFLYVRRFVAPICVRQRVAALGSLFCVRGAVVGGDFRADMGRQRQPSRPPLRQCAARIAAAARDRDHHSFSIDARFVLRSMRVFVLRSMRVFVLRSMRVFVLRSMRVFVLRSMRVFVLRSMRVFVLRSTRVSFCDRRAFRFARRALAPSRAVSRAESRALVESRRQQRSLALFADALSVSAARHRHPKFTVAECLHLTPIVCTLPSLLMRG